MVPPAAGAATISSAPPPSLPPSVEESYRRKCIQLRQRIHEVEEANDTSRVRLLRLRRGIDKMRLERAFLMEQLAKRTSTNVEDSEGSPSPPPTPKEKPLRTKRGHRKPDFLTNLDASNRTSTFLAQPSAQSPSGSEAFSTQASTTAAASAPATATAKGAALAPKPASIAATAAAASPSSAGPVVSTPPKKPRNAFEMFVNEARSVLLVANRQKIKEGKYDVDVDLARKWRDLGADGQATYLERFERGKEFDGYRERVDRDLGMWKESEEAGVVKGEGDETMGEDGEKAKANGNGAVGGDAEGDVAMTGAEDGGVERGGDE